MRANENSSMTLESGPGRGGATRLIVQGMTCGNCARHVTEALQSVAGVRSAAVDLEAQRAEVRWNPGQPPDAARLIQSVIAAGFEAREAEPAGGQEGRRKLGGWYLNLLLGVPITVVLMLGEWVLRWSDLEWFRWMSFGLAAIVQVFAGARFFRGAWLQFKALGANMDALVALGSSTAFLYSLWALFFSPGAHLYFMEAAAIITLISLGHWLEARMSARASSALRQLLELAPALARKIEPDGSEREVPLSELAPGDVFSVRPGDRVPTDGVVVGGGSAVDESMLTGESVPVEKAPGSQVYAGTLNTSGRLSVRVTATGEGTALAQVIVAVQRAQSSRANIQRLGDAVASVFVPVVVVIALLAALWWGLAPESARQVHDQLGRFLWAGHLPTGAATAFIIAASVLIIACPCAMGLATPVAIMAGSNAAATRGILIRDGVALEKAGKVTAVLFDKTGTLTVGRPALAKTWSAPWVPGGSVEPAAAALARHSSHPVSQALAHAAEPDLKVREWREIQGSGIEAELEGVDGWQRARLGSLRWLREDGLSLQAGEAFTQEWSGRGATLVGLCLNGRLAGLFAVRDRIKPGAEAVVADLQRQGLKLFLVTGDNPVTARAVAREAGLDEAHVFAEVRPEEKAGLVQRLQKQGDRVAFVGDGINDAPALEQADLGIAVSRASDIAREAADIILLKSEIEAVPESLGLARATLRTIRQNLFWAFFYNALGIPLAALGFMSPILCAAAMGLSDLVVIGNALRLRRWRR